MIIICLYLTVEIKISNNKFDGEPTYEKCVNHSITDIPLFVIHISELKTNSI
jgi:hypothetical protein